MDIETADKVAKIIDQLKEAKRIALALQLSKETFIRTLIPQDNPMVNLKEDKQDFLLIPEDLQIAILNTVYEYIEAREYELEVI